jgi:hypothetical protein
MDAFISRAFKDTRSTALTLGVGTVIATHTLMFVLPDDWQEGAQKTHAITNLAAAGAIVWGTRLVY